MAPRLHLLAALLAMACGADPLAPEPDPATVRLASQGLLRLMNPPAACAALAHVPDGTCTVDRRWAKISVNGDLSGGTVVLKDDPARWGPKTWTAKGWDPARRCRRTWSGDVETSPDATVRFACPWPGEAQPALSFSPTTQSCGFDPEDLAPARPPAVD